MPFQFTDETSENEAKQCAHILEVVESGSKSEYWGILQKEVQKKIKNYDEYINNLNEKILNESDLSLRNQSIFERKFLIWFLEINKRIIEENEAFIDNAIHETEGLIKRVTNFLK